MYNYTIVAFFFVKCDAEVDYNCRVLGSTIFVVHNYALSEK